MNPPVLSDKENLERNLDKFLTVDLWPMLWSVINKEDKSMGKLECDIPNRKLHVTLEDGIRYRMRIALNVE